LQSTDKTTSSISRRITLAQVLFFLNAAVWIFFLVLFLSDQAHPGNALSSLVIPILMGGNALAMLACGIGLGRRSRIFYYLSLAVMAVNILLTVTDQVGLFDYITLLLDLVILILLVAIRKGFTSAAKPTNLSNPSP
jgi:lysylphosphatidylglycerol synthetase-like protein (DUF2156 family)